MTKSSFKKYLLLTPVVVLLATILFLNHTVQLFKDTAYTFVYDTNTESVRRFSKELAALASQGYSGDAYGALYTSMIHNYSTTLGEKEAIITFMMDEAGQVIHSTAHNQAYLEKLLENAENAARVEAAYASRRHGEIELLREGEYEKMYCHWFYSGPEGFCLFMCVEKNVIETQVNVNSISLPICLIGLLMLIMAEYIIWMKMDGAPSAIFEKRDQNAD